MKQNAWGSALKVPSDIWGKAYFAIKIRRPTRSISEILVDFQLEIGHLFRGTKITPCTYVALFNFSKSQISNLHHTLLLIILPSL